MKISTFCLGVAVVPCGWLSAAPVSPQVAELTFDSRFARPEAWTDGKTPAWIRQITQEGGVFLDDPRCWQIPSGQPAGTGRLEIALDRSLLRGDLVASIIFEAEENGDVAVQLFDARNQVVVVDVFGNLVDISRQLVTDTFVIPLEKHPTAEKIVLRGVRGWLRVYGIVIYPVVCEGEMDQPALQKLAASLGDPLSPENPLVKGIQQIARSSPEPLKPATMFSTTAARSPHPSASGFYEEATEPAAGSKIAADPVNGLVARWTFDHDSGADVSGRGHDGELQGGATFATGRRGRVMRLRANPNQDRALRWDGMVISATPDLRLDDNLTVSAWVRHESIARTWGSQIVFHGDSEFGHDPWVLHLLPGGTAEFRSDRSVTGRPVFTVFQDEIRFESKKAVMHQHLAVRSPLRLEQRKWYLLTGTIERTTPRLKTLRLYVNGLQVSELATQEQVDYDTAAMWTTLGGVDKGTWQNFHGDLDDVRIYNRPLTPEEVAALYQQPWQRVHAR